MPFGALHWRTLCLVVVATACEPLSRTGRRLRSSWAVQQQRGWRWARSDVEVFDVKLRRLVFDATIINDQVVRDGELVMGITTEESVSNFAFLDAEFLHSTEVIITRTELRPNIPHKLP